ncbi:MAG: hypothetical protein WKF30_02540 [Pyrinomonadaceae bacterium]
MIMEDFGAQVASVWAGMRPHTRRLIESALQSPNYGVARALPATPYDSRAERELSVLLKALDERAASPSSNALLNAEQSRELKRMADACATLLQNQAQSAEAFAQLIERAINTHDYARIDYLADTISGRLAPSELCELTRHAAPAVRAIGQEALSQTSTSTLVNLLGDQVDAATAREALERQAKDYGSDEARWIVSALDRSDADAEEDEDDF